ncbi:hypothetical protein A2456_03310 [Candidatus Nomurabacteria bacterium RIFOXYC2_FULL_36_19]|uniref:Peptidase C39-like domain-containing protein n=3 Tax=Candidatus Nomuraibacteriota TaxID=1752729 RepID=A0A1F6YV39_9BACT|nr:MAG: hypothetical protein A2238_02195 [Candidatus Nomurabacteria bacterium RIFOXYA2_FULL_35_9]OGJ06835.1 MAG: hypothetical protein A2192_00070 [Candidatus Nomurabacteria bacterium RIFOXYA1_FULL_35_17]OGJ10261.1 MAG: hypothetical protein A2456_03310 [Candidatus Nomurabacteria bacterium RIFOXYC2_FULL_36_19]OGJ13760.1 MAG: hypothetical protein A2554_02295 [Candidatus Nomurabacteria bacterium RIFOXYD2_FULL_35_12]
MKSLPIDLNTFAFFRREKVDGKTVHNRCGRDFLFYALAFYFPDKFGVNKITAYNLEHEGHFGVSVPSYLAWMQIQFSRVPEYFKKFGLQLIINDYKINSFFIFVRVILFSRISYENAIQNIEKVVDRGEVAGVDISVGYGGLLDHVLFVYGYDAESFYVFETTETPIQYESVDTRNPQVMRISKKEIKKRWTHFGRVWNVVKVV